MSDENKARLAHDVLDGLFAGRVLSRENEQLLRSFLPEPPKQKTLEEIIAHVYNAWARTNYNEWTGNTYNPGILLEEWLVELHVQLQGLKDAPAATSSLPDGMRLADHAERGRVVVSPTADEYDDYRIFYLTPHNETGANSRWASVESLTFVDAKPTHPEFLETEADYAAAPVGTVAIREGGYPWTRIFDSWVAYSRNDYSHSEMAALRGKARVLRWAVGNEQL